MEEAIDIMCIETEESGLCLGIKCSDCPFRNEENFRNFMFASRERYGEESNR